MSWTNITWSPTPIHFPWPTSHGDIIAHYSTQEASDYRFFKCWLHPTFIYAPRKRWPRLSNVDNPSQRTSSPDLSASVPGWDSLDKSLLCLVPFLLGSAIALSNLRCWCCQEYSSTGSTLKRPTNRLAPWTHKISCEAAHRAMQLQN